MSTASQPTAVQTDQPAVDSGAQAVPAGSWAADPAHSSVSFRVRNMGIVTVTGRPTPPLPLGCRLSWSVGTLRPATPDPSAEFVMMPAYAVAPGASRIAALVPGAVGGR